MQRLLFFIVTTLWIMLPQLAYSLDLVYVDAVMGSDAYDGSSPVYRDGVIGPKKTIQAGINTTGIGGTCTIAAGTYTEQITVENKQLSIIGAGSDTTIIKSENGGTGIQFLAQEPLSGRMAIANISLIGFESGIRFGIPMEEGAESPPPENTPPALSVTISDCLLKGTISDVPWENDGIFSIYATGLTITNVTITNFSIGIRLPEYGVDGMILNIAQTTIADVWGGINGGNWGSLTLSNLCIYNADWGIDVVSINEMTPGAVSGRITKDDGLSLISKPTITVSQAGKTWLSMTPKKDGTYTITGLLPNTYVVGVSAKGYAPGTITAVVVTQGQTTRNINLSLIPSVNLISPNGGEVWSGMQEIRWSCENPETGTFTVDISYGYQNGYFQLWQEIVSGIPNNGVYKWDTGKVSPKQNYWIWVKVNDGQGKGEDKSDGSFAVIATRYGGIEGVVLLNEGIKYRQFSGITIEVAGIGTTTTGSNSYFYFSRIPEGTHTLRADTTAVSPWRVDNIVVVPDSVTRLGTFSLLVGDGNNDGKINAYDIGVLRNAFGSMLGQSNWNPEADYNHDNRINAFDIGILRNNFGKMQSNSYQVYPSPGLEGSRMETTLSVTQDINRVINTGNTFTVGINLSGAASVVEVHLLFDPRIIEVEDANPLINGIQINPGVLLDGGTIYQNIVNNVAGTIDFTGEAPSGGVLESGTIALITFLARADGKAAINFNMDQEHNRQTLLIDSGGNAIPFSINQASIRIGETPVCAYPNPFVAPGAGITFDSPNNITTIQVFNIAGELVFEKMVNNKSYIWDTRNNNGNEVASGVYIYILSDMNGTKTGKVAIVR